ncbi:hypothetical protein FS842_009041 [Serendipita sp. 407]|nr:hypothetical protein FRC18_003797 [Serendipita sp. 400]KAG9052920.1 hypothetical protein FS842_009041 [Serendipita sp. 407]
MASSTPPASSAGFERAQSATDRSQTPSRRTSEMQPIDAGAANAGAVSNGLDVPYQAQSASWDTVDFASARGASPGFPYTPSYRDSFTPYGSESGISWTGGHGESGDPIYDEPLDGTSNDVEYNPADFDGPNSHSNMASPYYLDHPQQDPRSGSIGSSEYGGYNSDQTLVHNNDHYGSHSRSFSNDNIRGGTPHARMNSLDVNSFSPRPYNAPSPASSVGGLDVERPRSRASSISSSHGPMPSLTVGPMGEAFDKLGFDSVDSDIMWRNQQQQQQQQQGVAKAQSPPSLMIPSDGPSSTLQIPSFGSHHQATLGAGLNTGALGGLSAPGINILPATPVSGGAGAAHVPFDTVLKNLNDRRQHQHQQQQQQQQQQHSSSSSNVMNLVGDNSSEPMHCTFFSLSPLPLSLFFSLSLCFSLFFFLWLLARLMGALPFSDVLTNIGPGRCGRWLCPISHRPPPPMRSKAMPFLGWPNGFPSHPNGHYQESLYMPMVTLVLPPPSFSCFVFVPLCLTLCFILL